MSNEKPSPIEVTISNMLIKPELQPDALKPLFKKLADLQPVMENVEKSIAQTKQSLSALMENGARVAGSLETLVSLLEEQLPDDLIKLHGNEYIKK